MKMGNEFFFRQMKNLFSHTNLKTSWVITYIFSFIDDNYNALWRRRTGMGGKNLSVDLLNIQTDFPLENFSLNHLILILRRVSKC